MSEVSPEQSQTASQLLDEETNSVKLATDVSTEHTQVDASQSLDDENCVVKPTYEKQASQVRAIQKTSKQSLPVSK